MLNHASIKHLEIVLLGKEGLNTVASTLNPFWEDILDN
jgi:hypothetical protein